MPKSRFIRLHASRFGEAFVSSSTYCPSSAPAFSPSFENLLAQTALILCHRSKSQPLKRCRTMNRFCGPAHCILPVVETLVPQPPDLLGLRRICQLLRR